MKVKLIDQIKAQCWKCPYKLGIMVACVDPCPLCITRLKLNEEFQTLRQEVAENIMHSDK